MRRGQFSIEMFFAFTFAILLVFWLVNYLEVFSSTNDKVMVQEQQKFIARDLGKIVNQLCVRGGSITIESPCLYMKRDNLYYNISVSPGSQRAIRISNDVMNSSATYAVTCPLITETGNVTRCGDFGKLCLSKTGSSVKIALGECE